MAISVPPLVLGSAYVAYNIAAFGHAMPISGAIKSTFPQTHFSLGALGAHGKMVVLPVLAISLSLLLIRHKGIYAKRIFSVLLLGVLGHALYVCLFSWGSQWYYTTAYVAGALGAMALLSWADDQFLSWAKNRWGRRALTGVACGIALLMQVAASGGSLLKAYYDFSVVLVATGGQRYPEDKVTNPGCVSASLIKDGLPADAKVLFFDAPGVIAYYSGVGIVPADGLVNDYDYDRDIVAMGLTTYLASKGIDYLAIPLLADGARFQSCVVNTSREGSEQLLEITSPLSHVSAGILRLSDDDIVLKIPNPVRPLDQLIPEVAVWRVKAEGS